MNCSTGWAWRIIGTRICQGDGRGATLVLHRFPKSGMATFRYSPGQSVRTRVAYPRTHCRTPYYLRGKSGVVERQVGEFRNPEKLAYGKPGLPKRPLYIVRFAQRDLWPDYAGPAADSLTAEIYEHWLEPVLPMTPAGHGRKEWG